MFYQSKSISHLRLSAWQGALMNIFKWLESKLYTGNVIKDYGKLTFKIDPATAYTNHHPITQNPHKKIPAFDFYPPCFTF